jgi:hypothetical protein
LMEMVLRNYPINSLISYLIYWNLFLSQFRLIILMKYYHFN